MIAHSIKDGLTQGRGGDSARPRQASAKQTGFEQGAVKAHAIAYGIHQLIGWKEIDSQLASTSGSRAWRSLRSQDCESCRNLSV